MRHRRVVQSGSVQLQSPSSSHSHTTESDGHMYTDELLMLNRGRQVGQQLSPNSNQLNS